MGNSTTGACLPFDTGKCSFGPPWGKRILLDQIDGGHESLCHTCQTHYNSAERYATSKENKGRDSQMNGFGFLI